MLCLKLLCEGNRFIRGEVARGDKKPRALLLVDGWRSFGGTRTRGRSLAHQDGQRVSLGHERVQVLEGDPAGDHNPALAACA